MSIAFPATPQQADPALGPLLNAFHACLCATLNQAGRAVCGASCGCEACCLVPGDAPPPADRCDCACEGGQGQAWVRWVRDIPYQGAGGQRGRRQCQSFRTLKVIEAGVYRCVSGPGPDGEPPSCAERERDALGLIWDRRLLMNAVTCCHALRGRQIELVSLQPAALKGGCAGVVMQFSVDA